MSRRSLADWKIIVEQQPNSGLKAAEFCRQNNLNQKHFSQYKCKFKKVPPTFIKVNPKPISETALSETYTLTCNGVSFQCSNNTGAKFIAQILRELQA
jgi:hypothetical protein